MDMEAYLIFDIGGTFVKYAVMREDGTILEKDKMPSPKEKLEDLLDRCLEITDQVKKGYSIVGISLSMPGGFNEGTGCIDGWSSLPYLHGPNVLALLEERLKQKVCIENDANCGALGELWKGKGREVSNFVYVVLGTGIGSGIVIGDKLYKGKTNQGGEFGYMVYNPNWQKEPVCGVGEVASTVALVRNVERKKSLKTGALNGERVFELAKAGDAICAEGVEEFYNLNAMLLLNIQFALDPDKIILSGPVTQQNQFQETILMKIKQLISKNNSFQVNPQVEISDMATDANLYGALYNLLQSQSVGKEKYSYESKL